MWHPRVNTQDNKLWYTHLTKRLEKISARHWDHNVYVVNNEQGLVLYLVWEVGQVVRQVQHLWEAGFLKNTSSHWILVLCTSFLPGAVSTKQLKKLPEGTDSPRWCQKVSSIVICATVSIFEFLLTLPRNDAPSDRASLARRHGSSVTLLREPQILHTVPKICIIFSLLRCG
jgi:hypothetical protein